MIRIGDALGEDTQEIREWISRAEKNYYEYYQQILLKS
jgi:hypothetical protein